MSEIKKQAILLRKKGMSYREIKESIGVPKSTLSYWLKNVNLSESARRKIESKGRKISVEALVKRNKEQTQKALERARSIRDKASRRITSLSIQEIFFLGIALYWAEGYKKGAEGSKWKCVDFANSDPDAIRLMMRFFREVCKVADTDFRIQLMLHDGLDERQARETWKQVTGLADQQFMKTSVLPVRKTTARMILKNGTLHVRVYQVDLFHQIIGWIDGIKKYMRA